MIGLANKLRCPASIQHSLKLVIYHTMIFDCTINPEALSKHSGLTIWVSTESKTGGGVIKRVTHQILPTKEC